ncbi:hypothetical protein BGZ73_004531 [Actinomortierella ambigua]|nr:hypothetical protein BGZ73_004531 [Actinomortierella ambigua]
MTKRQAFCHLLVALCVGFPVQWSVEAAPTAVDGGRTTCNTPYCAKAAKAILQDLHTSVDPCVDFSQFACGGYYERVKLKEDEPKASYLLDIASQNEETLHSFLISNKKNDRLLTRGDPVAARALKKVQSFYGACVNERHLVRVGPAPLRAELAKLTKMLLPPTGSSQHTNETRKIALSKLFGYNLRHGIEIPLNFELWDNFNIPGYRIMAVQQNGKGLNDDEYYKSEELLRMYTRIIGRMLYMIEGGNGRQPPRGDIPERWMQLASDVVDFERILAGAEATTLAQDEEAPPKSSLHNKTAQALDRQQRHILQRHGRLARRQDEEVPDEEVPDDYIEWDTVDDLNEMMPALDWHLIFKTAFPEGVPIPTEINMLWSFYLRRVNRALTVSSMETIRNYFAWTMIRTLGKELADPYRRPLIAFEHFMPGGNKKNQKRQEQRNLACIDRSNEYIGQLVGHFFVKSIFPEPSQRHLQDMVTSIRWTFEKALWEYDWLDNETRTNAIHKLKSIIEKLGFSHEHPNVGSSQAIEQWYKDLAVFANDHFGNVMRARKWRAEQFLREVSRPVNRQTLALVPQTVNAYYNPTGNAIEILAGILKEPFFHPDAPEYLNFAGIGTVVAHEIGHGFDNNGRRYDENGIIREWWTEASVAKFEEKAQCFMGQYGNYTITGPDGKEHHLNTWNTQGENIADNGGMRLSFNAWRHRYTTPGAHNSYENRKLPGLEKFSQEQLYFIQYARAFCAKSTPAYDVVMLNDDNHAPNKFRINGVVRNSVDFARAFQCKTGSPMNPVDKCVLW